MKKESVFLIAFIVLLLVWTGWGFWSRFQLENNNRIGKAQILKFTNGGGRGNAGSFFVDFIFQVSGKEFKSSSGYLNTDFDYNKDFIGKTFPVAYNPNKPSLCSILILPEDFARYNYSFPDSLKWVLKYER